MSKMTEEERLLYMEQQQMAEEEMRKKKEDMLTQFLKVTLKGLSMVNMLVALLSSMFL